MNWKIIRIQDKFLVTDYVANGSFAALRQNVQYRYEPDYAILIRTTDNTKGWNGNYIYIDENSFNFLSKSKLYPGDIIISNVGETGKTFICPDLRKPMTLGPNAILVRPLIRNEIYNKFFYYYTISDNGQSQIEEISSATSQKKFNKTSYRKLEIPLPPLETQKKIAEILDAADTLRQKTKTLIEKYDQLTQSLFLAMFGDPVVNNKKLPTIKLGELGKWQSGGTPSRQKPDYFNGDIPWLSSGELNTMFSADSKEHISSFAINESSAKIIAPGSLLLGMYDTAALKSTINQVPLSCNQAIAYCKIDKEIANTIYIYCIIQIGREHYRRLQRGVRQKNLNLSMISNIEILFPPISLQNQFAERVKDIEEQKAKAQVSLDKAEELFQSLLQKAFKGEIN